MPILYLLLLLPPVMAAVGQPPAGCPDKCGDMSIPFPFGFKLGCFLDGFQVTCNDSFTPPRAFLFYNGSFITPYQTSAEAPNEVGSDFKYTNNRIAPVELMDISVGKNEARAYNAISSACSTNETHGIIKAQVTSLGSESTFFLSATRNLLIGVGSYIEVMLDNTLPNNRTGGHTLGPYCRSILFSNESATNGSCSMQGCCEDHFPSGVDHIFDLFAASFRVKLNTRWKYMPCSYAMIVEDSWYNFSTPDMYGYDVLTNRFPRGVPFVMDFVIRKRGSCPAKGQQPPQGYVCVSNHSSCANVTDGYVCNCLDHYQGNPYITDGCTDINECELPDLYPCSSNGICNNTPGGYDCPCKPGMKGDGKTGTCTDKFPLAAKAAVGAVVGILVMSFLSIILIIRNEKHKTREFYRKNGGPTLEKAKMIKLFKKEELKAILKASNLIGRGGFGEVYKGLVDGVVVAVKKPINGSVLEKEQFTNEVIIQSQVIQKNIVKLIGCCLEVDTPMLVYEFLSNGSLDDILHGNTKMPLNLDMRLNIVAESARGLAYMHSQAHTKILHGDVKPANILLDDNFVPKISDFGISKLIARDKQHTASVIGDRTYMDPVYMQTGLLTEKSDVYSFGVVILELISRKKATHTDNNSLVRNFLEAHKNTNKATELFDKEIAVAGDLELLDTLVGIAVECLNLDVDQRPSMTEVEERLLILNRSRQS